MATTASTPSPASETDPAAAPEGRLTHRQILVIISGLIAGMFLAALDQTIVASSIRTIADDLQGLSIQAWATTAYLITATVTTPLYGKLSDLYGRKPFFLAAITLFVIGSALCAAAQSMYDLAAFRAVQGMGAGGLSSLALAIVGDIVSPRERARYQGYFVAVFGTASVLGPVIGGFFAGQDTLLGVTGWRWVFLVNVPIGAVALAVVVRVLNVPHRRRDHRIDWPGALALTVGLVPLLVIAEQGRDWGWLSGRALACYLVGVVGLALFVWAERRIGDDALLPLRFFRNSVFTTASLVSLLTGVGMFGGLAALPLYLQIVKGASPTEAGLLLIPLTLGIMSASIISGQLISRTGRYKIFPVVGASLMTVGLLLFSRIGVDTPLWASSLIMLLFGFGLGNLMQPVLLAVQNAMPPRDIGVATASSTFFRQMGGTLGTAVFLSVLFGNASEKIAAAFREIGPTPEFQRALADPHPADRTNLEFAEAVRTGNLGEATGGALDDSSFLNHLDPQLARPFLVGFSDAMTLVFLIGAAVMVVALVFSVLIKEIPLRTLSGIEARHQDEVDRDTAQRAADRAAADRAAATAAATATGASSVTGDSPVAESVADSATLEGEGARPDRK